MHLMTRDQTDPRSRANLLALALRYVTRDQF